MATSLSSAGATVPALTAPPTFSGVSKFASGLQQVLARAVGIASLPLQLEQQNLSDLQTTQGDLQGVDTAFANLQSAVASLQTTISNSLLSSALSDNSTVTASVGAGATAGTYTISVGSLGAYSTALSIAGSAPISKPSSQGISNSTSYTLTLGDTTEIPITATSSSLQDLVSAINSQANGQVQATLVNIGSAGSPDYRLSLQSGSLTTDAIGLTDSGNNNLLANSTGGSPATYYVDGQPAAIPTSSRTVTLSPGLTVNLIGQSAAGASTTITVKNSPSTLASALSSFAGTYNAAVEIVNQYHGQNAGALRGDSLLQVLTNALGQIGNYSNGSPATALANYGITLDKDGSLSVDTNAFTTAANANFSGLLATLGSTTQSGFLHAATNLLKAIEDPITGAIKTEEKTVAASITSAQNTVANEQASVNQLQTNLTNQIAKADSTIAELESQVSYVTGLFAQYTGATNTQNNGLATL